ncbi:MAG: prenyltransferase/squalene oxidase repeat-containing protein [Actinomycetota bacterium]
MVTRRMWTSLVAFLLVVTAGGSIAYAATDGSNAALKATSYLKIQQNDDGGYGAKTSTVSDTAWAVIAFKTAGVKLPETNNLGTMDYFKKNTPALGDPNQKVANTAQIAQLIVALKAAGEDPKTFAGTDWVALLKDTQDKAIGLFGNTEISHAWAIIALETAGAEVPDNAITWLTEQQEDNGGYAFDAKGGMMGADTNSTALVIQALIGAGEKKTSPAVKKALDFLKTQQNPDGGFPFVKPSPYGTDSDSNSTAWVVQALLAADEDIEDGSWVKTSVAPMGFLISLQNPNGAFVFQKTVPDDSLSSTLQAVPALMEQPFPLPTEVQKSGEKKEAETPVNSTILILVFGATLVVVILAAGLWWYRVRIK